MKDRIGVSTIYSQIDKSSTDDVTFSLPKNDRLPALSRNLPHKNW